MTLTWLMEADVFGRSMEPLKAELRRQGLGSLIVQPRRFLRGQVPEIGGRPIAESDPVVFSGTYPVMRHIQLHHQDWLPGGWCTAERFDCAVYYPRFESRLLNAPYETFPIAEAPDRVDEIFSGIARGGEVFLRPCSMEKTFTGRCVNRERFLSALESARHVRDAHALVSAPRIIGREWRLVVSDDRVVAASLYHDSGRLTEEAGCPEEVRAFAETMFAETSWRPDPIFMADVCESDGGLHLLELNSFSCSGLYRVDPAPVVARVRELVIQAWESRRDSG